MGATKTEHFTGKHNSIAILAKALGHPARIVNELPLAQATVSQHLKELKNAGLIKGSIEGNAVCYCIDEKAISRLQTYFANISVKLAKKKTDCC